MTLRFIPRTIGYIDKSPFGKDIAFKISKKLIVKKSLYVCGRNYGDLGFFRNDTPIGILLESPIEPLPDHFYVSEVNEGNQGKTLECFREEEEFIEWLSNSSEYSIMEKHKKQLTLLILNHLIRF